ncbi:MAG: ABC transporter [Thermoproteota archaeon]|nr:MAG: ABC transporter [Candidatus Korarchaeota archaeon]
MEAAVEVRGLTRYFGELLAVDHVWFDVPRGSVFGFLGPNGAGKTTTLRMIYGVLRPDDGDAVVLGRSVRREPREVRRLLGVMPEDAGIYPRLTAEENLIYFGKLRGMEEGELRERVRDLLSRLGLEEKRHVLGDRLSRGMKVKLSFARAILHEPPVLLLDEPTAGVDVMSAREIRSMIRKYAEGGRTVVISTHNMWEVERLCDGVAVINRGKIVFSGEIGELQRLTGEREFEEVFVRLVRQEVIET